MEQDYQSSSPGEEEIDETYDSDEDEDIQEDFGINSGIIYTTNQSAEKLILSFFTKNLFFLQKH